VRVTVSLNQVVLLHMPRAQEMERGEEGRHSKVTQKAGSCNPHSPCSHK